eukprot:TRINITY_DN111090_c0_g1_i1.p1 TRINITY_DN111090_c0_g1~~TRINITY_DN111090_c0_g1_i1.p1  ORF type:complete len:1073 (-),score=173.66 TRINITY_DN111090_c0_g1_i1:35-3253(-)
MPRRKSMSRGGGTKKKGASKSRGKGDAEDSGDDEPVPGMGSMTLEEKKLLTLEPASRLLGFYWVSDKMRYDAPVPDIQDVVKEHGVPLKLVLEYINSEMNDEASLKSLPFAILLIVTFALMFIGHDRAVDVQGVETAIDHDLQENAVFAYTTPGFMAFKTMYDVNNFADFWSWLRVGLMGLLYQDVMAASELSQLPHVGNQTGHDRTFYLWHNRKVGAMWLRQERSKKVACSNAILADFFGKSCTTEASGISADIEPEEFVINENPMLEHEELTEWIRYLDANASRSAADDYAKQLEKSMWVDEWTARVEVNFLMYNGNVDILTLNAITFVFSRTGHIWKRITHRSIIMDLYREKFVILWDVLFYGQITYIFLTEAAEVLSGVRRANYNVRKFLKSYISFWNLVDWAAIGMAYVIFACWCLQVLGTQLIKDTLVTLATDQEQCLMENGVTHCDEKLREFFVDVYDVGNLVHRMRTYFSFYPLIIILRLFKAFSAQPRLAVVTNTLANAGCDLYHFSIVLLSVFMTYVVIGTILFGREMSSFTTYGRSTIVLFRAMLGDFEMDEMRKVGRFFTTMFFCSFMTTTVIIVLNMLVAILMDVYEEVKGTVKNSETLIAQTKEFVERAFQNRAGWRISMKKIHDCVVEFGRNQEDEEMIVNLEEFQKIVPGINSMQALNELVSAAKRYTGNHKHDPDMSAVQRAASSAREKLRRIVKLLGLSALESAPRQDSRQPDLPERMRSGETEDPDNLSRQPSKGGEEGFELIMSSLDFQQTSSPNGANGHYAYDGANPVMREFQDVGMHRAGPPPQDTLTSSFGLGMSSMQPTFVRPEELLPAQQMQELLRQDLVRAGVGAPQGRSNGGTLSQPTGGLLPLTLPPQYSATAYGNQWQMPAHFEQAARMAARANAGTQPGLYNGQGPPMDIQGLAGVGTSSLPIGGANSALVNEHFPDPRLQRLQGGTYASNGGNSATLGRYTSRGLPMSSQQMSQGGSTRPSSPASSAGQLPTSQAPLPSPRHMTLLATQLAATTPLEDLLKAAHIRFDSQGPFPGSGGLSSSLVALRQLHSELSPHWGGPR